MITINTFTENTVNLYDPNNKLLGNIDNLLTFSDVRAQIKEQGLSGYYIIYKNQTIGIDRNGELEDWPIGLFDTYTDILFRLIQIVKT